VRMTRDYDALDVAVNREWVVVLRIRVMEEVARTIMVIGEDPKEVKGIFCRITLHSFYSSEAV